MRLLGLEQLQGALEDLRPEDRRRAELLVEQIVKQVESNPLMGFWPNSQAQADFLRAPTSTIAAIAGNQFGKTTSLVVSSLIQILPVEFLPDWMHPLKRQRKGPIWGRLVCPSYPLVDSNFIPTFREWCPRGALYKGTFDKAYNSQSHILSFADGSFIDFLTYETDLDKFGSVRRHFIGYDEPPPQTIRDEGLGRLMRFGGFEMFAFTPLKANTGWLRREIFKKREAPDITVVRGSVHDNAALDQVAKEKFLNSMTSDLWRRAREFGEFVDIGGIIYPEFGRCVIEGTPDPEWVREQRDIIVSIDPGRRNAGIVWIAFDGDNTATVFDELKLQDRGPKEYAEAIRNRRAYWGIDERNVAYVCDPTARSRGMVTSETVMSALNKEGIHCNAGQNDVDAGLDQMRTRMQHDRFHVYESCYRLRDEADDYAAEEPEEGKDDSKLVPIKGNDHCLDATRYGVMERFWDPISEQDAPAQRLGYFEDDYVIDEESGVALPREKDHDRAPDLSNHRKQPDIPPMGSMS